MKIIKKVLNFISQLNTITAKITCWLILPLIFVMTYEVVARYFFAKPTSWAYDLTWMLYGTIVFMGGGYTLLRNSHVRVDVIYHLFSERVRAGIEVFCYMVLFFPLTYMLVKYGFKLAHKAWIFGETSPYALWKPLTGPIKTVLVVGLFLLLLQGIVEFAGHLHTLITGRRLDGDSPEPSEPDTCVSPDASCSKGDA